MQEVLLQMAKSRTQSEALQVGFRLLVLMETSEQLYLKYSKYELVQEALVVFPSIAALFL